MRTSRSSDGSSRSRARDACGPSRRCSGPGCQPTRLPATPSSAHCLPTRSTRRSEGLDVPSRAHAAWSGRTRRPPALRPLRGIAPAHDPEPTLSQSGSSHQPGSESSRRPSSIASSSRSFDDGPRREPRSGVPSRSPDDQRASAAASKSARICPTTAGRCVALSERPRRVRAPHEIPVVRWRVGVCEPKEGGGSEGAQRPNAGGRCREIAGARSLVPEAWRLRLPRGVP
jgi:hypothetical protein